MCIMHAVTMQIVMHQSWPLHIKQKRLLMSLGCPKIQVSHVTNGAICPVAGADPGIFRWVSQRKKNFVGWFWTSWAQLGKWASLSEWPFWDTLLVILFQYITVPIICNAVVISFWLTHYLPALMPMSSLLWLQLHINVYCFNDKSNWWALIAGAHSRCFAAF